MADAEDRVPAIVSAVLATAVGKDHRADPVTGRTGGPAGNARLTAWLGLLLLVAFLVECATLIRLGQLISVHIVVGVLLVALVLAKTATTGWRILRYYAGDPRYREAGPPPLLLRLLGPLVVFGGLAVLATGLALIGLGRAAHSALFSIGPFRVDAVALHQAAFIVWLVVTIPHTLARLVPAVQLAAGRPGTLPRLGLRLRFVAIAAVVAVGAVAGGFVLDDDSAAWVGIHDHDHDDGLSRTTVSVVSGPADGRRI